LCCNIKFISGGTNIMDMAFKMGSFCELDESEAMMVDGGSWTLASIGLGILTVAGVTAAVVVTGGAALAVVPGVLAWGTIGAAGGTVLTAGVAVGMR
jgi:hypothetical protein